MKAQGPKRSAPGLSRETLKYLAVLAMTLDHIALMLPIPDVFSRLFISLGSFTAPVMLCFLIEGFFYTRSRRRYALRLLLFGLLAQPLFMRSFHVLTGNMLFTLLLCMGVLYTGAAVPDPGLRSGLYILLFLAGLFSDWSGLAVPFVLMLRPAFRWEANAGDGKLSADARRLRRGMLGCVFYYLFCSSPSVGLPEALRESAGLVLGFSCIALFYHGKRAERHRTFHQYFFYLYYPLHLLVLMGVRECWNLVN